MSIHEVQADVKAKDIMSRPVYTVKAKDTVVLASKLMDKHDIGAIIVVDKKNNPIGIITERDIVKRVAAKNLLPSKVLSENCMTRPLVTIEPGTPIRDLAQLMSRKKIRRIPVLDGDKLIGIVTSKDVVDVAPSLMDIASEKARIFGPPTGRPTRLEGYCDRCEEFSETLINHEGVWLCHDCQDDMKKEEPAN